MIGGGALRSASILEFLFSRYQTDVICFQQPEAARSGSPHSAHQNLATLRPRERAHRWHEIALPVHGKSGLRRAIRNVGRVFRGVPPLVDRFSGFHEEVGNALGNETYDIAVVEHFWCAQYAPQLRPRCHRLVLDLHNIESLWHTRCATVAPPWEAPLHSRFAGAARRMELQLLPQFDLVLTTSSTEKNSIAQQLPDLSSAVVPNTLTNSARPASVKEQSIVFSGNMEYLPNQQAACHFGKSIWPLISHEYPGYRWKILGKSATNLRNLIESSHSVEFVPDPEDAMIEIAKSRVAVVPLAIGTGTRLKIIEAWASGCPVVSTRIGAEGLDYRDGSDILIEDAPAAFARAVGRILGDESLAGRLADHGRKRFENCYSWESAWEALRACGL